MFINVTDKAVSRWESGQGTPEIGNLRMLSKIFNVAIDDILSCNEDVFSRAAGQGNYSETDNRQAVQPVEQKTENPVKAYINKDNDAAVAAISDDKFGLKSVSRRFEAVLLCAYIVMGMWLFAMSPSEFTAFFALIIVCISAVAALGFFRNRLPRKLIGILTVSIYSLLFVLMAVCFIVSCAVINPNNYNLPSGYGALAFLLAMQIIYCVIEFFVSEKIGKILKYIALAIAASFLLYAVLYFIMSPKITDSGNYNYDDVHDLLPLFIVLSAAAALVFSLTEAFSKRLNLLQIFVYLAAIVVMAISIFFQTYLPESIYDYYVDFMPVLSYITMLLIPFTGAICSMFEGGKNELVAQRFWAVTALICCILLAYTTIDIMAVNFALSDSARTIGQFVRLFIIIAVMIKGVQAMRFDLLIKKGKGYEKN